MSDDLSGSPASVAPMHNDGTLPPYHLKNPPSKANPAKRKGHISKGMIKRVEGGGVGLVNPMGWYDHERAETPNAPKSDETARESPPGPDDVSELHGGDRMDVGDEEHAIGDMIPEQAVVDEPEEMQPGSRHESVPNITRESPPPSDDDDPPPSRTPYAGKSLTDDAFPRSKTIAFDNAEDGMDHDHHAGGSGAGPYFPRTGTVRSNNGGEKLACP
jgi:hypothetical protein